MLVAPVNVTYNYEDYNHPMLAEFTGHSIAMRVPPDFTAGFNITDPVTGTTEKYILRSMELRKPGHVPEGAQQVLSHVFEVDLVHEETTGTGYWASVVVPLEVGEDTAADLLLPLVAGARLPSNHGDVEPVLVSGARSMQLQKVWDGASFLHSWTRLDTGCGGGSVHARQLMRNATLQVQAMTFQSLLDALQHAPQVPPLAAPKLNWALVGCKVTTDQASCPQLVAENLTNRLTQAQTTQSTALGELRMRKDLMDQALAQIANNSLPSLSVATDARDALRNAQAELDGATGAVDELQAWIDQANTADWSASAPPKAGANSTVAADALSNLALMPAVVQPVLLETGPVATQAEHTQQPAPSFLAPQQLQPLLQLQQTRERTQLLQKEQQLAPQLRPRMKPQFAQQPAADHERTPLLNLLFSQQSLLHRKARHRQQLQI